MTHRNFDEERAAVPVATFELGGHTFRVRREVRPEAIQAYEAMTPDATTGESMQVMDDLVMTCLAPEDHAAWREVRANDEDPVGVGTLGQVIQFLIESVVARPTPSASSSSDGPAPRRTGTRSTAASRSLEAVESAG